MLIEFQYKTSTSCRRKRLRRFWWTQTSPPYRQMQRARSNRTRFISCPLHPSLWKMWSNERNQMGYCCPWVDKLHLMSVSFNSTKNFLSILTPTILIDSTEENKNLFPSARFNIAFMMPFALLSTQCKTWHRRWRWCYEHATNIP